MPLTVEDIEKELKVSTKKHKTTVMSQGDQNFILKMAMSQLADTETFENDFYHQVTLLIKKEKQRQSSNDYLEMLVKGSKKKKDKFQATLDNLVQRKRTQVPLEGVLGKPTKSTMKQPRQVIEAPPMASFSFDLALKHIEDMYDAVMRVEQQKRNQSVLDTRALEHCAQRVLASETSFAQLMHYNKMMRVFPRVMRFLSHETSNIVMANLLGAISSLALIRFPLRATLKALDTQIEQCMMPDLTCLHEYQVQKDTFNSTALMAIQHAIMDMSWDHLNPCLESLIQDAVLLSEPGLNILTALLSRAEILKADNPSDAFEMLFLEIYHSALPILQDIFPLRQLHYPPPEITSPESYVYEWTNDHHVWQWLTALIIHADTEQQTELVSLLKDRILWNCEDGPIGIPSPFHSATSQKDLKLQHVNLFLHALGFDASQLRSQ